MKSAKGYMQSNFKYNIESKAHDTCSDLLSVSLQVQDLEKLNIKEVWWSIKFEHSLVVLHFR
jgi:hypothetical protein